MTGEEETHGLLGSRPVSARSEDDAPYEYTAAATENDTDSEPLWGKCIVLTLDIFNSLSLLLGGVLLAIHIYLREEWNKGISGEEIVSQFFLKVGLLLCTVAFAGYVSVRLTNKAGATGAQPGDYDVNRRHRKRLAQHVRSVVAVIYIFALLLSIILQFYLTGVLSVFIDSMSKQYIRPGRSSSTSLISPRQGLRLHIYQNIVPNSRKRRILSSTFIELGHKAFNVTYRNTNIASNFTNNVNDPKTENELRNNFDIWSKCTYRRCCHFKGLKYDKTVNCKKPSGGGNDDDKRKLESMCSGWPISKDVCSAGIQQFQKLAATMIELYIQPLIAFVVFNAFLQLTVMVLAILEICTVCSQYKTYGRLQLN
eukprot:g12500.t1